MFYALIEQIIHAKNGTRAIASTADVAWLATCPNGPLHVFDGPPPVSGPAPAAGRPYPLQSADSFSEPVEEDVATPKADSGPRFQVQWAGHDPVLVRYEATFTPEAFVATVREYLRLAPATVCGVMC